MSTCVYTIEDDRFAVKIMRAVDGQTVYPTVLYEFENKSQSSGMFFSLRLAGVRKIRNSCLNFIPTLSYCSGTLGRLDDDTPVVLAGKISIRGEEQQTFTTEPV